MARSKTIRVTPNVQKSLKVLKEATKSLPPGELKKRAEGAIDYLNRTFKGERQPRKGIYCPAHKPIVAK